MNPGEVGAKLVFDFLQRCGLGGVFCCLINRQKIDGVNIACIDFDEVVHQGVLGNLAKVVVGVQLLCDSTGHNSQHYRVIGI